MFFFSFSKTPIIPPQTELLMALHPCLVLNDLTWRADCSPATSQVSLAVSCPTSHGAN